MTTRSAWIVSLLLEDHERRHDGEAGLDHRRELTREDLQRLRLHLLVEEATLGLDDRWACQLLDPLGEQTVAAQLIAGGRQVRCLDLAGELDALGVDRAIGKRRHQSLLSVETAAT